DCCAGDRTRAHAANVPDGNGVNRPFLISCSCGPMGRNEATVGIEAFFHAPDKGVATVNRFEQRGSCRAGGFDPFATGGRLWDPEFSPRPIGYCLVRSGVGYPSASCDAARTRRRSMR